MDDCINTVDLAESLTKLVPNTSVITTYKDIAYIADLTSRIIVDFNETVAVNVSNFQLHFYNLASLILLICRKDCFDLLPRFKAHAQNQDFDKFYEPSTRPDKCACTSIKQSNAMIQ